MIELLSAPAFVLWGAPASWLELVAAVLALIMVACNMRELHWGWPLAVVSSLMYVGVFAGNRIYGDAALQVFFAVMALWGWTQWLRGHRADGAALNVARLSPRGWTLAATAAALLWPTLAFFLSRFTNSDVPWLDGFVTALSVVGQYLLARKFIENWGVWLAVNIVSVGLFIHKGLWLTVALYAVFAVLSVAGYVAWRARLRPLDGADEGKGDARVAPASP